MLWNTHRTAERAGRRTLSLTLAALATLALASCGEAEMAGGTDAAIEHLAAQAATPDLRAALLEFRKNAAETQKAEFVAGRYRLPLADSIVATPEIAGDARPGVVGGGSCKPKGCHVTAICHGKGDNPCDTGSIDVSCDTPC